VPVLRRGAQLLHDGADSQPDRRQPDQVRTVAATGLTIFFGVGPYTLAGGDRNPLARGLVLTNATIGLIKVGANFALDATGTAQTIGFGDTSVGGTVHVRVNSFTHDFNDNLPIAGTDSSVTVAFAGVGERGTGTVPFAAVAGAGVEVKVFGESLTGDVTIVKSGATLAVTASNIDLALSDQGSNVSARGPPFLHLTQGTGSLTISSAGVVASISGRVQLNLPGIAFDATLALAIDTTAATPSFHLSGTGLALTVLGQALHGDFTFDRVTSNGSTTTTIDVANGTLSLGATDGGPAVLSVDQGAGHHARHHCINDGIWHLGSRVIRGHNG